RQAEDRAGRGSGRMSDRGRQRGFRSCPCFSTCLSLDPLDPPPVFIQDHLSCATSGAHLFQIHSAATVQMIPPTATAHEAPILSPSHPTWRLPIGAKPTNTKVQKLMTRPRSASGTMP